MLEALKTVVVSVLSAFLALSQSAAGLVEHVFGQTNTFSYTAMTEQVQALPSLLADTFSVDAIAEQLRTDVRYQQAAVIGAPTTTSAATSTDITDALVNIFCTAESERMSRTTTGSGVFIDDQGVILTNAHVAQFLLLQAADSVAATRCTVRQGSPAISKYEAELLYISPAWIAANAHQLYETHPIGTGERDFALLYVTEALERERPDSFPMLAPHPDDGYPYMATPVRAAGYPAETLEGRDAQAPLVPTIATTSIARLFTFGSGTVDLIAIAPSAVGQLGVSGGPIVSSDNTVIGLIATRGNTAEEGAQSLRALTLSYINTTLIEETGLSLMQTLSGDLPLRAAVFEETLAPYLRILLTNEQAAQ